MSLILTEPLPLYGAEKTPPTAAQWYNAITSDLLSDGGYATEERIEKIIYFIAEQAACVMFPAWAKSADADLEEGLVARIENAKLSPIRTACLPESDGIDRNREDGMFSEDESLSDFAWQQAINAIASRQMSGNGPGNDIIWMQGEKEEGSRPCFKESAWDAFMRAYEDQLAFIFSEIVQPEKPYYYEEEPQWQYSFAPPDDKGWNIPF